MNQREEPVKFSFELRANFHFSLVEAKARAVELKSNEAKEEKENYEKKKRY